ncbi:hypothetical protein AWV63_11490 [Micromonospora rifamycinica]|uniref:hypothetical protein n=1 Tax=Micromonospora rifamycinica TaxID=291594 RepID=UPI00076DC736|nr:hypothetical protein [Micromonospora rifamycinica]KWV32590.1 hypothetical protein AWV63_11490 [Micromonospora rifamycinica]
MAGAELSSVERFVLITLMIKGSAVPNTYLRNVAGISLSRPYRDDLRDRGFIAVTEKPLVLELTEKGWGQAIEELGGSVPPRAGAAGGALYIALGFLRSLLDHLEVAPSELFTLRFAASDATLAPAQAEPSTTTRLDVASAIREAYGTVAQSGELLPLTQLRTALKSQIDATLVRMNREPGVQIIPNSQQGDLTAEDRAAAVRIGNQDRHLISITS